jgi:hypothetical protein
MVVTRVQSLDTGSDEFQIVLGRAGTGFNLMFLFFFFFFNDFIKLMLTG